MNKYVIRKSFLSFLTAGMTALSCCAGAVTNASSDFLLPVNAAETAEVVTEAELEYATAADHIAIHGYTGTGSAIELPSEIGGLPVTEIYSYAFSDSGITSIIIPESVTAIEKFAFYSCETLTEIQIKNPDCEIGNSSYTMSENTAIFGEAGSTAQAYADEYRRTFTSFDGTVSLVDIASEGVIYFKGVESASVVGYDGTVADVTIASEIGGLSVTAIYEGAFMNSAELITATIPESIESIADDAFSGCRNLTDVYVLNSDCEINSSIWTFPSSCTLHGAVGSTAQEYATQLQRTFVSDDGSVSIGSVILNDVVYYKYADSVSVISASHYEEAIEIVPEVVGLPVTAIEAHAFTVNDVLERVIIPDSVNNIEDMAFEYCTVLADVYIYNPDCVIADSETAISETAVIHGMVNSTAQEYAEKYGREFAVIPYLGDVNRNGVVDVVDATLVLQQYSYASMGGEGVLDDEQQEIGNVDGNTNADDTPLLDVVDATHILRYFSYKSMDDTFTWEELFNM